VVDAWAWVEVAWAWEAEEVGPITSVELYSLLTRGEQAAEATLPSSTRVVREAEWVWEAEDGEQPNLRDESDRSHCTFTTARCMTLAGFV
jgi:hypothetical protein